MQLLHVIRIIKMPQTNFLGMDFHIKIVNET
jgi:hypothetical protein